LTYCDDVQHTVLAGSPTALSGPINGIGTNAQFSFVSGVAVAPVGGYMFLTEYNTNKIRKVFTNSGKVVDFIGGGLSGGGDGVGTMAALGGPLAVVISPDETFAVSTYLLFTTSCPAHRAVFRSGDNSGRQW
jgi:DNA-binding beta-propeller fold protein YncE